MSASAALDQADYSRLELSFLLGFRSLFLSPSSASVSSLVVDYVSCDFLSVLNESKAFQSLVQSHITPSDTQSPTDLLSSLSSNLSDSLRSSPVSSLQSLEFEYFLIGLSCFHLFIQSNFTGPALNIDSLDYLTSNTSLFSGIESRDASKRRRMLTSLLSEAGEDFHESFIFQSLFLIARFLLVDSMNLYQHQPVTLPWWAFRLSEVHSQALETHAQTLKQRSFTLAKTVKERFGFDAKLQEPENAPSAAGVEVTSSASPSFSVRALSDSVHSSLRSLLTSPSSDFSVQFPLLHSLFLLELSRYHQRYWRGDYAGDNIDQALSIANLSVCTTGIMGNRTKYQVEKKAQLVLMVTSPDLKAVDEKSMEEAKRESNSSVSASPFAMMEDSVCSDASVMPRDLELNSDVLLEEWALDEKPVILPLSMIHRALLLAKFDHLRCNQPTGHISIQEELLAYLYRILASNGERSWIVESTALLHRSLLESKNFHKQDRALQQLEDLGRINQIEVKPIAEPLESAAEDATPPEAHSTPARPSALPPTVVTPSQIRVRLCDFFYCGFASNFHLKLSIGNLFESMKFHKSALQMYESILHWDGIIELSITLGRKTRAETFIQERMAALGESPKFLCLLGDLSENPEYYERAWRLSGETYPRAQRALGKLKRLTDKFEEAIHHYQLALALNPVFPDQWFALGFCSLQLKQFDLASTAFARTVALDPEYGDAWNNLAVAHLSLKRYRPAFGALEQAIKCQFDSWKLWENYLMAAIQLKEYQAALTALEKVWELKGNAFSVAKAVAEGRKASEISHESNKKKDNSAESGSESSAAASSDSTDNEGISNVLDPEVLDHLITAVELNIAVDGRENNFLLQKLSKVVESIRNKSNMLYEPTVYKLFSRALALNQQWNDALMELERAQRESSGNSAVWTSSSDKFGIASDITAELGEMYLKFPTAQNIYAGKVLLSSFISRIDKNIAENSPIRTENAERIEKLKSVYEKLKSHGSSGSGKEEQKSGSQSGGGAGGSSYAASLGGGSSYLSNSMWR